MQDCKCRRGSRARGIAEISVLGEAPRAEQGHGVGRPLWIWALGTGVFLR